MRSQQIVRLQQQFLTSLHDKPTDWLLDQIIPAPAFKDSGEVLGIYLHRAMARTIDPLHSIYKSLEWLLGETTFETLIEQFYAESLGEPLSAQALATEFVSYLGELKENESIWQKLSANVEVDAQCKFTAAQALVAAAFLDWRCHWVSLMPHQIQVSAETLHKRMHHRSFIWLRPRLNSSSRMCVSGFDLVALNKLVDSNSTNKVVPFCPNGPETFLIHADYDHNVVVRQLSADESRLLNHCDGTHTIASIAHEALFFERTRDQTKQLLSDLIDQGVITALEEKLT